jgi:hypothetical protein
MSLGLVVGCSRRLTTEIQYDWPARWAVGLHHIIYLFELRRSVVQMCQLRSYFCRSDDELYLVLRQAEMKVAKLASQPLLLVGPLVRTRM